MSGMRPGDLHALVAGLVFNSARKRNVANAAAERAIEILEAVGDNITYCRTWREREGLPRQTTAAFSKDEQIVLVSLEEALALEESLALDGAP